MLKIDKKYKNYSPQQTYTTGRITPQEVQIKKNIFENELNSHFHQKFHAEINELINKLTNSGNLFSIQPNQDNLRIYKRDVQAFLHFVTKQSYKIKEIFGRRVDYKIVDTINEKLEDISKDIIIREIPRMTLLAKIDEIRGLIIDLVL